MSDPFIPSTPLVVSADGADGSTIIYNGGAWGVPLTAVGNARISTAQSKFGGSSLVFDGNGDKVLASASPDFVFGSGDFTLEGFVYLTGGQAYARMMHFGPYWNDSNAFGINVKDADYPGKLSFASSKLGSSRLCVSTTNIALNTWYHVAVTRTGGVFRLFIDGVLESTNSSHIGVAIDTATSNTFALGSATTTSGGEDFAGHIDEVRISRVSRYTTTFTPPAEPFPVQMVATGVPIWNSSINPSDSLTSDNRGFSLNRYSGGWTVSEWCTSRGTWYFEAAIGRYGAVGVTSNVGPATDPIGILGPTSNAVTCYVDRLGNIYRSDTNLAPNLPVVFNCPPVPALSWGQNTQPVIGVLLDATSRRVKFYYQSASGVQETDWFYVPGTGPIYAVAGSGASAPTSVYLSGGQDGFSYPLPVGASAAITTQDILGATVLPGVISLSVARPLDHIPLWGDSLPGMTEVDMPLAPGPGRIAGTLKIITVPASREVRLYDRHTGQLLRRTVSTPDGRYVFDRLALERPYLVVGLDAVGVPMYNASVADMITLQESDIP